MRKLKASLCLVAILFTASCANMGPKTVKLNQEFDEQSTKFQMRGGNNTAKGSALIRRRNGGIVTCAGAPVRLVPATPYQRERMQTIYGSTTRGFNPAWGGRSITFENEHPNYKSYIVDTVCDSQGMFKFENLADGSYYVIASITWKVDTYTTEGGSIFATFDLSGGKVTELTLTP